ncbi:hypothetical protein ADUPG1_004214, partial [Aduncisulcus paluster]
RIDVQSDHDSSTRTPSSVAQPNGLSSLHHRIDVQSDHDSSTRTPSSVARPSDLSSLHHGTDVQSDHGSSTRTSSSVVYTSLYEPGIPTRILSSHDQPSDLPSPQRRVNVLSDLGHSTRIIPSHNQQSDSSSLQHANAHFDLGHPIQTSSTPDTRIDNPFRPPPFSESLLGTREEATPLVSAQLPPITQDSREYQVNHAVPRLMQDPLMPPTHE